MHGTTHEQVRRALGMPIRFSLQPIERAAAVSISQMTNCAKWRAMRMCRGRAAATRCRGSMRARKLGARARTAMWRCTAAASASPSMHAGRHASMKSSRSAEHHEGIPLGRREPESKMLVQMRETAPAVEVRPLAAYESVAMGGAR